MSEFFQLDLLVFRFINLQIAHPILDAIMIFLSAEWPWFTLLIGFVSFLIWCRDLPRLMRIFWIALTVGFCDATAHNVLKPWFGRLRPCRIDILARVVDGCSGWYSFPSNHAANAAAFAWLCFFLMSRKLGLSAAIGAVLIGFSRIYLGVHYPFDILGGFGFGTIVAMVSYKCFSLSPFCKRWPLVHQRKI